MSISDEFNHLADLQDLTSVQPQVYEAKKKVVDACIRQLDEFYKEFAKFQLKGMDQTDNLLILDVGKSLNDSLTKTRTEMVQLSLKLDRLSQAYSAVIKKDLKQLETLTSSKRSQKAIQNMAMNFISTMFQSVATQSQ